MPMSSRYKGGLMRAVLVVGVVLLLTGLGARASLGQSSATPQAAPAAPASAADAEKAAKQKAEQAALDQALSTTTPVGSFPETTTATGAAPLDLTGVWLVVVHTRPIAQAPDKYQNFVQLVKVTGGATPKPTFHILDVQLPMQKEIDQATHSLTAWNPTPEELAMLRQYWSKLPPYKEKNLNQNIYAQVEYTLVTPDHYTDGLAGTPTDLLNGSTFAVRVLEHYRPGRQPEKSPVTIAQIMGRESIYAFTAKGEPPAEIDGQALVKFTVAGAGFPLPLNFGGSVRLYKIGNVSS